MGKRSAIYCRIFDHSYAQGGNMVNENDFYYTYYGVYMSHLLFFKASDISQGIPRFTLGFTDYGS